MINYKQGGFYMQISTKFTIAVHIITCIDYFKDTLPVTSSFLAGSVGVNPVIIRGVMSKLKEAGIIAISQGKSGMTLARPLTEITFYDVYKVTECVNETGLFHMHENPNPNCPVGKNIQMAMEGRLRDIQAVMEQKMKETTIADVAVDIREKIKQAG